MNGAPFTANLPQGYGCSFGVITVVNDAHQTFLKLVGNPPPFHRDDWLWTVTELPSSDGGVHTVVEGQANERSLLPALAFAERMLRTWSPRCLLIADCGGGIQSGRVTEKIGLALGDVVVSENLHYYELQKLIPDGAGSTARIELAGKWLPASNRLTSAARQLDKLAPEWREGLSVERPDEGEPQIKYGEIVCGDKLLSDPDAAEVVQIQGRYPRAIAVDMETIGVAHAALNAVDEGLGLSFVALRGVCDWIDAGPNQATRDAWQKAACEAAVGAAIALIQAAPEEAVGGTPAELDSRRKLHKQLTESYPLKRPYESQIQADDRSLTRNDAVVLAAETHGTVLIGDGGVGKSSVVHHAVLSLLSPLDFFPVLIDLKRWRPAFADRLAQDPSGDDLLPSLDSLLRASMQKIGCETLEKIAVQRPVMMFVDGLNEVPFSEVGRPILTLLDEYMRKRPNVRVLVTDRTAGEFYRDNGWQVAQLEPLAADEVRRVVAGELGEDAAEQAVTEPLLRIPFFLDRAMGGKNLAHASRAKVVEAFFTAQLGIKGSALAKLAEAAFGVYLNSHRRTFSAGEIAALVDAQTLQRLRDAGAIAGEVEELSFDHQIEHDFLAARHLAQYDSLWTPEAFDAVTFEASTFDILGQTLELIKGEENRDTFLRRVHDWNWRGAISALAATEQDDSVSASRSLRTALLAVIAEKKFDPAEGTRRRSVEQLHRFQGPQPQAMAAAVSLDALIELVDAAPAGPEWFEVWRRTFRRLPAEAPLDETEAALLGSEDPVVGWTMANVVRRFPIEAGQSAAVRALYADRKGADPLNRPARWRAVHVLGAWPDEKNAQTLLDALEDEYMWVTYGAVRSLTEMAALSVDVTLRGSILAALEARLDFLSPEPLSQIAYASCYHGASADFAAGIRPLLDQILEQQGNESERKLWLARIDRFEEFWMREA